jgi:phosphoglycerate dehydrogenase-like enzyme
MVIPAVGPKLPAALFEGSHLQLVQVTGAGVDRLDQAALTQMGIAVSNVPGGSNSAVAEYAVTAASSLLRRLGWADYEIRNGNYEPYRARMLADNVGGIDGLLVGVVGLGTIGKAVARAFQAAGCSVAYFDPSPLATTGDDAPDAQAMSFDDLLRAADIVTLHVPLLPSTRGLIDSVALEKMKPDAVLINASRGGIVDEIALADHLSQGRIAGAAVDVYTTEPPTRENPLLSLRGEGARRLLLTPHIAGVTRQSAAFLFSEAWNNVDRVLTRNQAPLHRVY